LLLSFTAYSQKGTIRGVIYDKENGEPIIFANVVIEGTSIGAATDENGIFTIPNVPVGNYNVLTFSIEHDTVITAVEVKANKVTNITVFSEKKTIKLKQVEINAEREEAKTEVKVSTITISTREITRIPNVGGEPDLAQYLQVIPGVVSTGDQGLPFKQKFCLMGLPFLTRFIPLVYFLYLKPI
jgi:hypothetical protein